MKRLALIFLLIVGGFLAYKIYPNAYALFGHWLHNRVEAGLPEPLRVALTGEQGHLTHEGVISETNQRRVKEGLAALRDNSRLDAAAQVKLNDLFQRQYFEHVSPQGKGPSDLANEQQYKYLVIGENLALGNFEDDSVLVQAWMDSPGHRENILHSRYEEIGVAVGQGVYEGQLTWVAVQEFGAPLSSCAQPDETLKRNLESTQRQINEMQADLARRKAALEKKQQTNDRAGYNSDVGAYNEGVNQLNKLIADVKIMTIKYNAQVTLFNKCLQGS